MRQARKVKTPLEVYEAERNYLDAQILMCEIKLETLREWRDKIWKKIEEEQKR